jgi:flagellar hook-associated protein FlgK
MYSTFHGLEIVKRSLMANKQALDVISHNVSNANTEGYSRQRLDLGTESPLASLQMAKLAIPGQLGQGVVAQSVERIRSSFLDQEYRTESHIYNKWSARYDNLKQVQQLLNEPSDQALRSIIDDFWKGWEDLANDPQTPATRKVVVERGISLTTSIKESYQEIQKLQDNLNDEVEYQVGSINRIADNIADLNLKIKQISGSGDNPNDLLDRRDLLLDKLSKLMNIDQSRVSNDQMVVSVNGQTFIQDGKVNHIIVKRNTENKNYWELHWEENDHPISSDDDVATVFANSSVSAQTDHLEVNQLAKKHELISKNGLTTLTHAISEDDSSITSGSFTINGATVYVDVNKDSLQDVIRKINDATIGVTAKVSDTAKPGIILTANQEGTDNTINLQSGSSNFLRKIGLVAGIEGKTEILDKDAALYGATAPLGVAGASPYTFQLNGKTISIDTDASPNGSYSLQDIANEINNTDGINVKANILKKPSGNYVLELEGKDGTYNFTAQDTAGENVLSNLLGIPIENTTNETFGSVVGSKIIKDQTERGLLNNNTPSSFQITDSSGTSFSVNIDSTNDSLELVKNEINSQALTASANIEASIIQTPEGEYRLSIHSTDGGKFSIKDTDANPSDGTILNEIGLVDGTYNELGPYSVTPQNSKFVLNGINYEKQSNRIDDAVNGMVFTMHQEGSTDIEVRHLFTGGKIKGLLESRDENVSYYLNQLDELSYSIINNINHQHFKGFGLNGETNRAFFNSYSSGVSGDPANGAALSMSVNDDIKNNANYLAAASAADNEFTPDGLPISGGPGDGSNALKIAQIKQDKILNNGKADFSEFFTSLVSKAGVDGEVAKRNMDNREALLNKIDNQRKSFSGVSLDEEMANMIKYQQAYNAAAKMANTMDSMFNTIITKIGS